MKTRLPFRLLLPLITLVSFTAPLKAVETPASDRRVVVVGGDDTVRIPATRARLTVMIETQAETPAAAQESVRERSQTLLGFLQRSGVERLQAGALSLHPVYGDPVRSSGTRPLPQSGPVVVAYRAQWSAHFEVAAGRAGEIADGVVKAGAARITGFSFTATDDEFARAQQLALRNAALKARADAAAVLEALGHRIRDVVRIEINGGGPIQPLHRGMEMAAFSGGQSAAPTAVDPGHVDVNASLRLEVTY